MGALEQLAAELLGDDTQKVIAAENPYVRFMEAPRELNKYLNTVQPQTSGDLWGKAAAASLGGLFGAGMEAFGDRYQNTLQDRYKNALNSAIAGQEPDAAGLPAGLFGRAKRGGALWNMLKEAKDQENVQDLQKQQALLLTEKPWLATMYGRKPGAAQAPTPAAAEPDPLRQSLQTGKSSTDERYRELYQQNLEAGIPPTQAATGAKDAIRAELKANVGSVDKAAKSRAYAEELLSLADEAELGVQAAGETGPLDRLRGLKIKTQTILNDPEAERRLSGRQTLDSIKPKLVKMGRTPGAVSDYEAQMILAGGPTTEKTEITNQTLINNWRELATYNQEYADFLDTYREVNGTISGAEKLWNEYRRTYPLFQEGLSKKGTTVKFFPERPSWQEFFINRISEGGGDEGGSIPQKETRSAKSGPPQPKPGESKEAYKRRVKGQ